MLTILNMYDHLNWANKRILTSLDNIQQADHKAIKLFGHILQAEQIWITRLKGKDSSGLPLWEGIDLSICAQLIIYNQSDYKTYLTQLTSADLDHLFSYKSQDGKPFQTTIRGILTHVALHGQYHRGQINTLLRSADVEPINVDFITFVR